MHKAVAVLLFAALFAASPLPAQSGAAESGLYDEPFAGCPQVDFPAPPPMPVLAPPAPQPQKSDLLQRILRYTGLASRHRLEGLASYYSAFFDGRKTASGETFRNQRYSAAHLTLPLGCWIEVKSRATGRTLRLKVNDRGPYTKKFALDLSIAAARYLGVDTARDRHVEMRVIALPGEEPLPEGVDWTEATKAPAGGEPQPAPAAPAVAETAKAAGSR